jgi:hypothetical protein
MVHTVRAPALANPGHQAVNRSPYDGPVDVPLAGLFAGCFAGFGASVVDSTGVIAVSVKNAVSGLLRGCFSVRFADILRASLRGLFAFWVLNFVAECKRTGPPYGVRGFVFVAPVVGFLVGNIARFWRMTMTPAEAFTQASEAYLEALQAYLAGDLPPTPACRAPL